MDPPVVKFLAAPLRPRRRFLMVLRSKIERPIPRNIGTFRRRIVFIFKPLAWIPAYATRAFGASARARRARYWIRRRSGRYVYIRFSRRYFAIHRSGSCPARSRADRFSSHPRMNVLGRMANETITFFSPRYSSFPGGPPCSPSW